jgi:curved DNA-binding protein CbpA
MEGGTPTFAQSNQLSETLIRLAIWTKTIPEGSIQEYVQWKRSNHAKRDGEFLRQKGISQDRIEALLRRQVVLRFSKVLSFSEGFFRIQEGVRSENRFPVSPFRIFLEYIQTHFSPEDLIKEWKTKGELSLSLTPDIHLCEEIQSPPISSLISPLLGNNKVSVNDLLLNKDPESTRRTSLVLQTLYELQLLTFSTGSSTRGTSPYATPFSGKEEIRREDRIEDPKLKQKWEEIQKQNYFEVLGISENATEGEIKRAYFRLAREFHPDRHYDHQTKKANKTAEAIFSRIVEAYEVLKDPEKRKQYLEFLRKGTTEKEETEKAEKLLLSEGEFEKGLVLFRQKKWGEAMEYFRKASELSPQEPEYKIYLLYSQFMEKSKKKLPGEEEIRSLEKILLPEMHHPQGWFFLGRMKKIQGDLQGALSALQKAIKQDPNFFEAKQELRIVEMAKKSSKG